MMKMIYKVTDCARESMFFNTLDEVKTYFSCQDATTLDEVEKSVNCDGMHYYDFNTIDA